MTGWGTGGTLTGAGEMIRLARPEAIIVAEPDGAALLSGKPFAPHKIQGWTPDFVPAVLNREGGDRIVTVTDAEAIDARARAGPTKGIFVGISSGATFGRGAAGGARGRGRARACWPCCPTPASAICRRPCSRVLRMAPTLKAELAPAERDGRRRRSIGLPRRAGSSRRSASLPDPFPPVPGRTASRGAHCLRELGPAQRRARQRHTAVYRSVALGACRRDGGRSRPGWWEAHDRSRLAIDTSRYFVMCVNSLGSCFGSTGPAASTRRPANAIGSTFPEVAVEDIARAGFEAARALGIERLAVVGASLGGSVVVAFAALFPQGARRLISISGVAAASPFAIALRSVQREAILSDPDWQGGNYSATDRPLNGMRVARKLGTITYRSATEWRQRFGRGPRGSPLALPPDARFRPASRSRATSRRRPSVSPVYDPNCYLYLSRAMDRFDLAEHGGSYRAALERAARRKECWCSEWKATSLIRSTSRRRSPRPSRRREAKSGSRGCPRSRGTTLSWWISSHSPRPSGVFSPTRARPAAADSDL